MSARRSPPQRTVCSGPKVHGWLQAASELRSCPLRSNRARGDGHEGMSLGGKSALPVTAASSVLLPFDFREIRFSRIRSSSSIRGLLIGAWEGTFARVIPQDYSAAERSIACSYTSVCAIQALY